ncbi:histidine kinase [Mucilaginibacter sp. Bleaf8]|nr:histidine kinase [Mucilaginibacter sp. Bleaf8]
MYKQLCYIVCFLLVLFCRQAFSQQEVKLNGNLSSIGDKLELLVDTNSNISLQQALRSKDFKRSESQFPNLGITPYSYWIRFTISNQLQTARLGIQIAEPLIDKIEFFQLKGERVISSNLSGQSMVFNSRFIRHQNYIYPVDIDPGQSGTFYFHIKCDKQLVLPVYAGTFEETVVSSMLTDILFGIYAGIILVMLLYNLFIYVTVKDINYLYYVSYLLIVILTQACLEGYLFRFVIPTHPTAANLSIYIASAAIGLAAIEFAKNFLAAKQYTPVLYKVSYVFWAVYLVQIGFALGGYFNTSYTLILAAAMLSAIYVMIMAITIAFRGFRAAKYFLIAWSVFIVCVVIYVLKDFNIVIPYNKFTASSLLIGSAFEAVMLSFALADKINVFKAEKEKSQEEALHALQENERIIREQNVILEAKVNERTFELSEANEELNQTLEELKEAQAQLVESEKMASLGQLTAGIAHEINNPINFVTSNIKPLSRDIDMIFEAIETIEKVGFSDAPLGEKQKQIASYKEELDFEYLTMEVKHLMKGIREGANRTAEIVKGLRVFSRLDQDDLTLADLNEGLESTLVIANNMLNKVKVIKEYGDLPKVECYAGKLNQVFLNLISNAAHAIHRQFGENTGGELFIKTTCDEENAYIVMKDNGIGMDELVQKKIFEPFFTTKDVGEGTGLGMSISYNTIKKHSGTIDIISSPSKGAEFRITLPIIFKVL